MDRIGIALTLLIALTSCRRNGAAPPQKMVGDCQNTSALFKTLQFYSKEVHEPIPENTKLIGCSISKQKNGKESFQISLARGGNSCELVVPTEIMTKAELVRSKEKSPIYGPVKQCVAQLGKSGEVARSAPLLSNAGASLGDKKCASDTVFKNKLKQLAHAINKGSNGQKPKVSIYNLRVEECRTVGGDKNTAELSIVMNNTLPCNVVVSTQSGRYVETMSVLRGCLDGNNPRSVQETEQSSDGEDGEMQIEEQEEETQETSELDDSQVSNIDSSQDEVVVPPSTEETAAVQEDEAEPKETATEEFKSQDNGVASDKPKVPLFDITSDDKTNLIQSALRAAKNHKINLPSELSIVDCKPTRVGQLIQFDLQLKHKESTCQLRMTVDSENYKYVHNASFVKNARQCANNFVENDLQEPHQALRRN